MTGREEQLDGRERHIQTTLRVPRPPIHRRQGHGMPQHSPVWLRASLLTSPSAQPGISIPKPPDCITKPPSFSILSRGGGSAWPPKHTAFLSHTLVPLGAVWRQRLLPRHCHSFLPKSPFLLKRKHPVLWGEAIAPAASLPHGHSHSQCCACTQGTYLNSCNWHQPPTPTVTPWQGTLRVTPFSISVTLLSRAPGTPSSCPCPVHISTQAIAQNRGTPTSAARPPPFISHLLPSAAQILRPIAVVLCCMSSTPASNL